MTPERGFLDQPLELHLPEFGVRSLLVCEAFSTRQRHAIINRDGGKCQAPFPHVCDDEHLEVHHVLPQGFSQKVGVQPDYPENALTLCKTAHDFIHPDRVPARREYYKNPHSFQDLKDRRAQMLDGRTPYWNVTYDRQMQVIAVKNTQKARKDGNWDWPEK